MSFVRALAMLAAGYATAKGVDQFRKMGGFEGLQKEIEKNPALANMQTQFGEMMDRMGVPGGSDQLKRMSDQWTGTMNMMGDQAAAGFASLLAALNGAAAAGAEQSAKMMETFTGNTAPSDAMEENAKLMIRAMIQAAKADGEIDPDERKRIMSYLGDLSAEEKKFVEAEMKKPLDLHGLAMDTGEQVKAQVYAMSLMATKVDTGAEAQYLDGLASALGLSDETRKAVHDSMQRPDAKPA